MTPEVVVTLVTLVTSTISGMFYAWLRSSQSVNKSLTEIHGKLDRLAGRQDAIESRLTVLELRKVRA